MPPPACRLYLITPPAIDDLAAFGHALGQAFGGGDVGAVQLRLTDPTSPPASTATACISARRTGLTPRRVGWSAGSGSSA